MLASRKIGATVVSVVVCSVVVGVAAAAFRAGPPLSAIVLEPAEIGPGYRHQQRPDGHGAKFLTLDVCAFVFPSETLKTDRLQVNYLRSRGSASFSNEVVRYRPGKAAQALREVRYAATHCPAKPRISPYFGPPAVTHRVTLLADRRLPRGYVAIHNYETAVVKGKHETATSVAIYQQRGDVLSAVYVHPGNRTTPAQLRATAFHAAEAAARRLAQVA